FPVLLAHRIRSLSASSVPQGRIRRVRTRIKRPFFSTLRNAIGFCTNQAATLFSFENSLKFFHLRRISCILCPKRHRDGNGGRICSSETARIPSLRTERKAL